MEIKTDVWEAIERERLLAERERKAEEYIEYCITRRYERYFNILMVIGGFALLSLVVIKQFMM